MDCRGFSGLRVVFVCDAVYRSVEMRVCGEFCSIWEFGVWSFCFKSCGRGFKRRLFKCLVYGGRLLVRD